MDQHESAVEEYPFDVGTQPQSVDAIDHEVSAESYSLTKRAELLRVTTAPEAQTASGVLAEIASRRKRIEAWFADPVAAAHRAWKTLTERRAAVLAKFTEPEQIIKTKLAAFRTAEEAARREAEKQAALAAQEAARAAQLAQAEAAMDAGDLEHCERILDAPAPPVLVPPVITPPPTKLDGVAFVEEWRFEVVDEAAVPREYLCVDAVKIRGVVRALKGATAIPGVRVWPETTARNRGR